MEESHAVPQNQSNIDLPPLLALPLELTLQIISIPSDTDEDDDGDAVNKIALIVLRRTHSSFRRIIPKPKPTYDSLFEAEEHYPELFPWDRGSNSSDPDFILPCYDCLRFFDCAMFCGYLTSVDRDRSMKTSLGQCAGERFCSDCWWNGPDDLSRYWAIRR